MNRRNSQKPQAPPLLLLIKKTKKYGRGVFADQNIRAYETILTEPVLTVPAGDSHPLLRKYVYAHGRKCVLGMGYSSFVNHSKNPNCDWYFIEEHGTTYIRLCATRNIASGQQLFINYGYDPTK